MLTSGTLSALQELLASWLAHDKSKHGHYFSSRIPKMAAYGAFVSAPMGHVLIGMLQWVFAGRTSLRAKILQILVSNLIVRGNSRPITPDHLLTLTSDCPDPKHRVSVFNGLHRRRTHMASSARHRPRRFLARYARQLDHLANRPSICPEFPAGTNLGPIFQHCGLLHWHLHQHTHQEEEACCFEEEGKFVPERGCRGEES